jgi:hypothetical protein
LTSLKGGAIGEAAIIPGHGEKSPLLDYVSGSMPNLKMPPKSQRKKFPALSTDEVGILRAWIDQGAEWPKGTPLASPMLGKKRRQAYLCRAHPWSIGEGGRPTVRVTQGNTQGPKSGPFMFL